MKIPLFFYRIPSGLAISWGHSASSGLDWEDAEENLSIQKERIRQMDKHNDAGFICLSRVHIITI